MDNQRDKMIAKKLAILWAVSFAVFGLAAMIFQIYCIWTTGSFALDMLSPYQLIVLFAVLLYFYPLLFFVHRYSKRAEWKAIRIISLILLCFLGIWLVGFLIFTILALNGVNF